MVGMAFKRFQKLAAGNFKNLDELVRRAGGQLRAVGAETDAKDLVAVTVLDVHHLFAGGNLKDFNFSILAGSAAAGSEELAVGRKAQRHDTIHEPGDLLPEHSGMGIPQ